MQLPGLIGAERAPWLVTALIATPGFVEVGLFPDMTGLATSCGLGALLDLTPRRLAEIRNAATA